MANESDVLSFLPARLREAVRAYGMINELRLRREGELSLTAGGKNLLPGVICTSEEFDLTLKALCTGSLYAHDDTIRQGYIDAGNGIRAGICGRALTDGGHIEAICDISSICIRLPRVIRGVCGRLCELTALGGVLIYSPPGQGKTTLLRDLSLTMASPPHNLRVCVIDSRGELFGGALPKRGLLDVFSGCPKGEGIELATRVLSPELLVCDEIGGAEEAKAILEAQNSGVPLVASAHAAGLSELLRRPQLRALHEARIFESYLGIRRRSDSIRYELSECRYEDVMMP